MLEWTRTAGPKDRQSASLPAPQIVSHCITGGGQCARGREQRGWSETGQAGGERVKRRGWMVKDAGGMAIEADKRAGGDRCMVVGRPVPPLHPARSVTSSAAALSAVARPSAH